MYKQDEIIPGVALFSSIGADSCVFDGVPGETALLSHSKNATSSRNLHMRTVSTQCFEIEPLVSMLICVESLGLSACN